MDLKRAWRNGFLVSVIFAIPLSDLYNNQYSNLIADDRPGKTRVQHASHCGTDASCTGSTDGDIEDIAGRTTSWDDSADENRLTIPGNTVTDLLVESNDADFSDIQKAAIQFDPQDIFQSEQIGENALDITGTARQNMGASIGSMASLSYGFGNTAAYAPGFSGPFMPVLSSPGGKSASAGLQRASGNDAETTFVDPLPGSSTQSETGALNETPSDTASSGNGEESLHNVPEPPSFVLITIGTIALASQLYRKSRSLSRHS
jgi:hypothetical protein